jgi:putative endonuclease
MAEHNDLGVRGEKMAVELLRKKGYRILDTNWRFGKDELDIIARDNNELVIVEVKTRSTEYFGYPEDFINKAKMQRLVRAAAEYIDKKNIGLECRYDFVSIVINRRKTEIRHIKDAFYPF